MTNIIQRILTEWETDSKIDRTQLDLVSFRTSELHSKYLQLLTGIRSRQAKLKAELAELSAMKTMWYSGKMSRQQMDELGWPYDPWNGGNRPLKTDVHLWLESDKELGKLRAEAAELELARDTVMDIMDSLKWRHQHIRNAVDWMKFTSGH